MPDDSSTRGGPTRRDTIKYGGAVVGGGLLAGCTGQSSSGRTPESTPTDTATEKPESTATDSSYEACIEPTGCVTFRQPPETHITYTGGWADMAFALGQRDGFLTAGAMIPGFFFEPFGLDVPPQSELPGMWDGGWDKEALYELDPDVFLLDPNLFEAWDDNWDESDTEEMIQNVAHFFGSNSRRHRKFHDYKLYTLYECLEKCSELFQQRDRYEALVEVHDDLQQTIQSRLPSEPPTIALINGGSNPTKGEFFPLSPRSEGYVMKPYRDLNVRSAFPDAMEGGQTDYEGLLEVDPEIIMVHWGIGTVSEDADGFAAEKFHEKYVAPMEEHPVGSEITAVKEGNVYPGQYGEQGPITNLLQTEMVAQQLYPEEFGAFAPESFPNVPEDRRLFDRQRVRDIIAGEL